MSADTLQQKRVTLKEGMHFGRFCSSPAQCHNVTKGGKRLQYVILTQPWVLHTKEALLYRHKHVS